MEIIKIKCNICNKVTDHQIKEYKNGHEYRCLICKKILYEPNQIKKEYI
jgi:hypothetical protein